MSVCCYLFRYRLSPETFGYIASCFSHLVQLLEQKAIDVYPRAVEHAAESQKFSHFSGPSKCSDRHLIPYPGLTVASPYVRGRNSGVKTTLKPKHQTE